MAINTQRPPLDDVRIRKAMQLLYDRRTMIKKLYYDEYEPLASYYQNSPGQNPANQVYEYDEFGAVELLEQAGYTEINDEGYRLKGGKELTFTVSYRTPLSERNLTVFQEACKKAGIRIELELLTSAQGWKNMREKEFDLSSTNWGATIFPTPKSSWHSRLATQKDNNNVTSFANERVDELIDAYDKEHDFEKRSEIVQEIDSILYNDHPYVLGWFKPAQRVVYWNKYGTPEPWGSSRYARGLQQPAPHQILVVRRGQGSATRSGQGRLVASRWKRLATCTSGQQWAAAAA